MRLSKESSSDGTLRELSVGVRQRDIRYEIHFASSVLKLSRYNRGATVTSLKTLSLLRYLSQDKYKNRVVPRKHFVPVNFGGVFCFLYELKFHCRN